MTQISRFLGAICSKNRVKVTPNTSGLDKSIKAYKEHQTEDFEAMILEAKNKIQVLHITPSSDGYEVVDLVANRVSRNNGLSAIIKNGKAYMTGGLILEDNAMVRNALDKMDKKDHYKFALTFRRAPWVKSYLNEN